MARKPKSVPTYRHHKASGQAFIEIQGQRRYLGKWDSEESRESYARVVAELAARPQSAATVVVPDGSPITVVELAARYWEFAQTYYVKGGAVTSQTHIIRTALRTLRSLYGSIPCREFGPLALQAIQEHLIRAGKAKKTIAHVVGVVKHLFKWGVSQELVPPSVYQALATVPGLRKGRTTAREPAPVLPVAEDVVDATLPFLPPVVDDMVRFQRLTGCRPGEVCSLRPIDLDRSGDVWAYRPAGHKTEHLGRERIIYIGPQAQEVILPYLLRSPDAYCFSPAESDEKRKQEMRAARKTKVQPSQVCRRKARPKRKPKGSYTKDSYGRAVRRAVAKANKQRAATGQEPLPLWHPNQLRHSVATRVRREFGLEGSQVVLGHARADVTQVYAERDGKLAAEIMRRIG